MKRKYIEPQVAVFKVSATTIIANSPQLGTGSVDESGALGREDNISNSSSNLWDQEW